MTRPSYLLRLVLMAAFSLASAAFGVCRSQESSREVRAAIGRVEKGEAEDVKKLLPDLAAKYQNNPDVLYLQGRLATDGIEGVKFYQSIVDNFPKSEFADDALYHIYQYYYAIGLYRTAEMKMSALKNDYPTSPYLSSRPAAALPAVEEPSVRVATSVTVPAASPTV